MSRRPFALPTTEIGAGPMLIEASAGTGKTFTIAGLVLRLLLERPELTIDRILVTTFTELATAELRTRIREKLRDALAVFRGSLTTTDELLLSLRKAHAGRQTSTLALEHALAHFDQAPIYTIHGFCQRVLRDNAFESGGFFDAELEANQAELLREIANDFWRITFYEGDSFAALLALKNKISPETLFKNIEELTRNPLLRVLPSEPRSLDEITGELQANLEQLRTAWRSESERLRDWFAHPVWAKGKIKDPAVTASWLEDLEQCLSADGGGAQQLQCLQKLSLEAIRKGVRVGFSIPTQGTFELCQTISDLDREFGATLQAEFFAFARKQLRERKLERNVFSFDDLLTRLNDALAAPGGAELAAAVREKYRAALIDEFQDTDPVQYAIFSRIYHGSDAPVAFIGDPKQAIYAFRGADVFTYMQAAAETPEPRRFTLTTNWRSESRLVHAVNAIFDHPRPFLLDEIGFDAVTPSPRADSQLLRIDNEAEAPFRLWLAGKEEDLYASVSSEVVQLLTSNGTISDEQLQPRHLAILTKSNIQAARVQRALRDRGVPTVLYSTANIFLSHEAHELRDVLSAVMQPGYEKFVRAALSTDALGRIAQDLDALSVDESAWEKELLRFQELHQLWREKGFIQMLRQLSDGHGVRERLLGFPDGERRLTNFLHLAELLHGACVEHRLGMNGLLKWLGQRMQEGKSEAREEQELRLESDERAVRILTVHKSKGLEFDVVFCPFASSGGMIRNAFHDPEADNELTIDLAAPDAHKERRDEESRAEQLRVLYVALTRAKHRCTMVWKEGAKTDKSAPAYLLGNRTDLPARVGSSGDILVGPLPAETSALLPSVVEEDGNLEPREFSGAIDRSWGNASFSRLISGRENDPLDEGPALEPPVPNDEIAVALPLAGIHDFPKGMRAGTCLHEILEKVNFADLSTAPEIVHRRLHAYGIAGRDEAVLENLHTLTTLPLAGAAKPFSLQQVPNDSRLAELEFSFPVSALTKEKLGRVFQVSEIELHLERLQFQRLNGFMNGFIDLVFEHDGRFYFADWKSNWLGPDTAAYTPAAVATEMQRHFYTLQLSLYSVALHRYLRVRKRGYDFARDFGGAFYIFLRGIDPARPENGVYFQRLSEAFVERLSGIFEK